jgi:hypothetical protein
VAELETQNLDAKLEIDSLKASPVVSVMLNVLIALFALLILPCLRKSMPPVNTKIWYRRESDSWAQLGKKSRPEKEGFFKRIQQRNLRSVVCFRLAKGLFALISRDCMVTWPERKGRVGG